MGRASSGLGVWVVSEPDAQKEHLGDGLGWKCTKRNVQNA